jgi:hypothetical protein
MPNRLEQNRYPGDDFQSPTFHLPRSDVSGLRFWHQEPRPKTFSASRPAVVRHFAPSLANLRKYCSMISR